MPLPAFDEAARQATDTSRPVPRGIAFRHEPPTLAAAQTTAAATLPGWEIRPVAGLPDWFEATPPAAPDGAPDAGQPLSLGEFWGKLRQLRVLGSVAEAEPLLLIANPYPPTDAESEKIRPSLRQELFALWGWPYDPETVKRIAVERTNLDWHLKQLNVRPAWSRWAERHPGRVPGAGILVGHPDTGYCDHPEVTGRLRRPGWTFLRGQAGAGEADGRDDLATEPFGLLSAPGHGTATASVIASPEVAPRRPGVRDVIGVAPGAEVLPLRVSRSVVHFDFSNVGNAILRAVEEGADVISMSLGGPGYSGFVRRCIGRALDAGVIVVSAAGNNTPATVFPAAFPEVIAVAATHAAKGPWRFSGVGRLVDIAAPGEDMWHANASLVNGQPTYQVLGQGTGTSFATACVAGLAALWLSYHGGRETIAKENYGGEKRLVPFAFQFLLAKTADPEPAFVREGKHGAGIADAAALLAAKLPERAEVERFEQILRAQPVHPLTVLTGLFTGVFGLADRSGVALTLDATLDADRTVRTDAPAATAAVAVARREQALTADLIGRLLGPRADELAAELLARLVADRRLLTALQRWRPEESVLPVLDLLLSGSEGTAAPNAAALDLSPALWESLQQQRGAERERLGRYHRGQLIPGVRLTLPGEPGDGSGPARATLPGPARPAHRLLRAYAFDPTLETNLDTAPISQVTIRAPWERLEPGPRGEYLEVVDIDPASGCVYSPVDLNHPHVLGQNGLAPSEGDPGFHQQMVYAVAMNTIHHFELALGRPIFWSPVRPWLEERPEEKGYFTPEAVELIENSTGAPAEGIGRGRDRYVQRLRVYPHALREANAYYSPSKRAVLFGYFPAAHDDSGRHYPGGTVFTCLSHDIIAHETTHALLDGMHPYFVEPSNEDVWAFHEAFADIVALFQHFTYPEVLRHQIANTRGDLESDNLLAQLAQQFGQATGARGALRDALGGPNERGEWVRKKADARALSAAHEPHARGSILIAAVFDAFLALYNNRAADLLRIATGGTGVLPAGRIHPDLVNRLASEAAATAEEVLRICIRAMDYVPPVDITFGEFLRALITADYDLSRGERRQNRIAFIDACRSWGIYPRDVTTLSEDSLRWRPPADDDLLTNLRWVGTKLQLSERILTETLAPTLDAWQPGADRSGVFREVATAQAQFNRLLKHLQSLVPLVSRSGKMEFLIPGLDLRTGASVSVGNLRPARRIGADGEFRTEMVVEVVQTARPAGEPNGAIARRGGATLVVDLRSWDVRYVIYKRLYDRLPEEPGGDAPLARRLRQPRPPGAAQGTGLGAGPGDWRGEAAADLARRLAETYACEERRAARRPKGLAAEPFAFLHRGIE